MSRRSLLLICHKRGPHQFLSMVKAHGQASARQYSVIDGSWGVFLFSAKASCSHSVRAWLAAAWLANPFNDTSGRNGAYSHISNTHVPGYWQSVISGPNSA